jgi:hypothetical protein
MTDLTVMAAQIGVDPAATSGASAPGLGQSPGAPQRFEAMLDRPLNADVYTAPVKPQASSATRPAQMPQQLFQFGKELSAQMRATFEKSAVEQSIDTQRFPELAVAQAISSEMRQFMLLDMQIHFLGKSAEISEKGLQTLYKQQG